LMVYLLGTTHNDHTPFDSDSDGVLLNNIKMVEIMANFIFFIIAPFRMY